MKIHKKPILCSCWNDAYKYFTDISDKYFPNTKKIESEVKKLYSEHKGDPCWDEAYRRWLDSPNEEDDSEILYVIKDRHGNQLSSTSPNESALWKRVSSLEAKGRTGLSVVVYSNTKNGKRSKPYRPIVSGTINRSFTCPSCHNKTLYCTEHDVAKIADVDHGDQFVCDECGSCFIAEPQFNGDLKFKQCFDDIESSEDFEDSEGIYWMARYKDTDNKMHKIIFRFDSSDFESAEEEMDAVIPEPYTYAVLLGRCDPYFAKKEGFTLVGCQQPSSAPSTVTASEDFEDYAYDIQEISQEFTSEDTSINNGKLPAIFSLIHLEPGTINIDYGGGKFDNVAEYYTQYDVINLVYDPYNRTREHNKEVLRTCKAAGGADTATCSNVLNVIKEPEVRRNVLENIKKIVKPTGTVYITVYEGSGKGDEGPTSKGYQLRRKTEDYLQEIREVFPDAVRKGKLIIAHPGRGSVTSAEDLSYDALTSEDYIYDLWTLTQDEDGEWVREDKIDTYYTYEEGEAQAILIAEDGPCELIEIGPDGTSVVWTSQKDIYSSTDAGLQSRIFDYLDDVGSYLDYNGKIEDVVDEFGVSPDVAETYVCNWIQKYKAEWSDDADIEDDGIFGSYRSIGAPREEDLPSRYWEPGCENLGDCSSDDYDLNEIEHRMYTAVSREGGDLDDFQGNIQHFDDGGDKLTARFLSYLDHEDSSYIEKARKSIESALKNTRFNSQISVSVNPPVIRGQETFANYEILIEAYSEPLDEPDFLFSSTYDYKQNKRRKEISRKELSDKLYSSACELLKSPSYGFPLSEIDDILFIDISTDEYGLRVEVRAELSYDGMCGLKEKLDPIVQEYDKDSYFDMDEPGIMSAYLYQDYTNIDSLQDVESADYGGAYDVDPTQYFTKDELMDLAYDLADEFSRWTDHSIEVEEAYIENNMVYIALQDLDELVSHYAQHVIDMRRIRKPADLNKYKDILLKKLQSSYQEYHDSDDWDDITSATYDYPERSLDPPEDPEYSDETDECTVDLDIDTIVHVDRDGSWSYEEEPYYEFVKNLGSKDGWWYSDNDEIKCVDPSDVVEDLDEFIEDRMPALPGRYRITGKVTLVYDVEGIRVDYVYDAYEESSGREIVDTDSIEVTFNESKSNIESFNFEKLD